MTTEESVDEVMEAHGGRDRWKKLEVIEASLSSGGFAFASRFQSFAPRDLNISVNPHTQRVLLKHFCGEGCSGIWTPTHVQIKDGSDLLLWERHDPRAQFGRLLKKVRWDKLDILYFAGYALWNYLSFPFILDLPGVSVTEAAPINTRSSNGLIATFDYSAPTHSATQSFSASRHLVQHDYTADVIGSWATAANCCLASEQVGGFRFYTRRKVYSLIGKRTVMPFPRLVWIELNDINVVMAS
jgi:hypothetical protein